eukprot:TRINITY_DN11502_c0_g6_i1.p1 TRINITY_DN11502_c0_g6~~TRINITY_DN11502_c0_g6_i1.p1  ORF type:complete len:143 (-),score=26.42 TRINITY_DN11502_c0_g6_i1:404-832(-)
MPQVWQILSSPTFHLKHFCCPAGMAKTGFQGFKISQVVPPSPHQANCKAALKNLQQSDHHPSSRTYGQAILLLSRRDNDTQFGFGKWHQNRYPLSATSEQEEFPSQLTPSEIESTAAADSSFRFRMIYFADSHDFSFVNRNT